jgi:outer membrane protein assembly factor BamB
LNPADGKVKWIYAAGGAIRGIPLLYTPKDATEPQNVVFASFDNFLYDLRLKNGGRKWLAASGSRVFNKMHFDRALIFIAPFGATISGFDPHTGRSVGDFNTGARVRSAPITAKDKLYIGLNDGKLLRLSRTPPPPPEEEQTQTIYSETETEVPGKKEPQSQIQSEPQSRSSDEDDEDD